MSSTFDLKPLNLPVGTHEVLVKAKSACWLDSEGSTLITYIISEQITAPTISIKGDELYIHDNEGTATSFKVLVGGEVKDSVSKTAGVTTIFVYDLTRLKLPVGEYVITVIAEAEGCISSEASNEVIYTTLLQLAPAFISINGNFLKIYDASGLATSATIFVNGEAVRTIDINTNTEETLDPELNHSEVIPEGWALEYTDDAGEWVYCAEGELFPDKSIYTPDRSIVYYSGLDHYCYSEDGWHYDELYGEDQEVIILESINGIPVTTIDNLSGQMGTSAISATIPTSVTKIIGVGDWMGTSKLTSIIYLGTVDQWNAITLEDSWNQNCPEITVTCTDGTITIPAYGS